MWAIAGKSRENKKTERENKRRETAKVDGQNKMELGEVRRGQH